jgi:hypothetical protein
MNRRPLTGERIIVLALGLFLYVADGLLDLAPLKDLFMPYGVLLFGFVARELIRDSWPPRARRDVQSTIARAGQGN